MPLKPAPLTLLKVSFQLQLVSHLRLPIPFTLCFLVEFLAHKILEFFGRQLFRKKYSHPINHLQV